MNKILRQIGASVIGLLSLAVPVLTIKALYDGWNAAAVVILFLGDICEFFIITAWAYERSEE